MKKGKVLCSECAKERERCRQVTLKGWVCPKCWKELEFDRFIPSSQ